MSEKFAVIGKPLAKLDAPAVAAGDAKYAADYMPRGALFGRLLRSPVPHAHILNIDASRALRLVGVKGIVTGKDTLGFARYGGEVPIAISRVRYAGEPVAAVAATSEDTAEEAISLIQVEYESLPAVFDPEEALHPGAPQLYEDAPGNTCLHFHWDFGDVDKAFAESYHVREDRFACEAVNHAPLEPHTILAHYDGSGRLTAWASAQAPYVLRQNLALCLGIPESRVKVIKPHLGGAFGGKGEVFGHDVGAALLSRKTGLPVLFALTREEVFGGTRQRHPMVHYLKTGVDREGRITARYCKVVADGGAYLSMGRVAMFNAGIYLVLPYRLPNFRYDGIRAYTNKSVSGAHRGFGGPQSYFAAESQLDMIAADMGMDPTEIRLLNAVPPGYTTCNQMHVGTCSFSETIERAALATGWKAKRARGGRGYGIGIGCNSFVSGVAFNPRMRPTVVIEIQFNGGITLFTGASDLGQGSSTVLGQIAAEELGVRLDDISVALLDTDVNPVDLGSFSSRVTTFVGNAAKLAAAEAKRIIFDVVAGKLEASPEDLVGRDRRIYVKGVPDRGLSFKEAIRACFEADVLPIVARGAYDNGGCVHPSWNDGVGQVSPAYSFGSQIAEVEVDEATGRVTVLGMTAVHDCGVPINPLAIEGQVEGSIAGGLGQALTEQVLRENGQIVNGDFLHYAMPTAVDMPGITSATVGEADPAGPFGAKESGESLQCSTSPAIANAVFHAIGVRIKELPITPEKVLAALEEKRARERANLPE